MAQSSFNLYSPGHWQRNNQPLQYGGNGARSTDPGTATVSKVPTYGTNTNNWIIPNKPKPKASGGGGGGGGGSYKPKKPTFNLPKPPQYQEPQLESSIPMNALMDQYLPPRVVQQGINLSRAQLDQAGSVQPMVENMAANQNNMASASSGQAMQMLPGMVGDYTQASALANIAHPEAALQRYDFQTGILGNQAQELNNLQRIDLNRYLGRLGNYGQDLSNQSLLAALS